jgi:hypothetical protein
MARSTAMLLLLCGSAATLIFGWSGAVAAARLPLMSFLAGLTNHECKASTNTGDPFKALDCDPSGGCSPEVGWYCGTMNDSVDLGPPFGVVRRAWCYCNGLDEPSGCCNLERYQYSDGSVAFLAEGDCGWPCTEGNLCDEFGEVIIQAACSIGPF